VIPGRGGLQVWPLNRSSAYFSKRPFANAAAENPAWAFFDSIYRRQGERTNHFRTINDHDAAGLVDAALGVPNASPASPLLRSRPNIVVVLWESASARAFGSLGGLDRATPRFDALAPTGVLFRRFYASGDRTDKGLAAVLSGFPALPTGSILMVPNKQRALPKLATDLDRAGYHTAFYYGGELEFASLQAHLVEAGFDRIVGKRDFPSVAHLSKWGAPDGIVADRLVADLDRAEEPFFAMWLTLSSHEPFDQPGPARFPGPDWQSRYLSSMAYTDQVIGAMVDSASTRRWWANTLFVVLGDHGRRIVPVDEQLPPQDADTRFRIPMLWLGGALGPRDRVSDEIGSQTDLPATLLDLAGVAPLRPYRWARSLVRPASDRFAYYAFPDGFGIVTERGSLVYDHRARRISSTTGAPTAGDERLGRALMQLTYQDYLDR
jgi:phosphoglycerol transferase MdoB-like AlkP superfamily enzyme